MYFGEHEAGLGVVGAGLDTDQQELDGVLMVVYAEVLGPLAV
jgi:hypothetical protein